MCECTSPPPPDEPGKCPPIHNSWIYDKDNKGDGLTPHAGLCAVGNVSLFQYDASKHVWTWQCVTKSGTDMCTIGERRCGDTVVTDGEECE